MNENLFSQMVDQHNADTPALGIVAAGLEHTFSVVETGRKKGYTAELVKEAEAEALAELEAKYSVALAREVERIDEIEKTAKAAYMREIENAPRREMDIRRYERRYAGMADDEILVAAMSYVSRGDLHDPAEIEILGVELRKRHGDKHQKNFRTAMTSREYDSPWKKLVPARDREIRDLARRRGPGQFVFCAKSKLGEEGASLMSFASAMNLINSNGDRK